MSAELLRKAAGILRDRAKAAHDITGASDWFVESRGLHFIGEYGVRSSGGFVAGDTVEEEAAYIATVHPGVGFALADWLDLEATAVEQMARHLADRDLPDWPALTVARLIVGGDS